MPSVAQAEGEVSWYALYTRARHEKRVDALLRERGFEAYLPLVPRLRQWHDRKKVVEFPMFPSYVFVRSVRSDLTDRLATPGVASVVRFDGHPIPIPSEEMANVRRFVKALAESGTDAQLAPLVSTGQAVRVISGPFSEVEGIVVERRGQNRALIQVGIEAIRQGLKVELGIESLKVLNGHRSRRR